MLPFENDKALGAFVEDAAMYFDSMQGKVKAACVVCINDDGEMYTNYYGLDDDGTVPISSFAALRGAIETDQIAQIVSVNFMRNDGDEDDD